MSGKIKNLDDSGMSEERSDSYLGDLTHEIEMDDTSLDHEVLGSNRRMTEMIKNQQIVNVGLQQNLDTSQKKFSEISQLRDEEKERIQELEQDVETLRNHFMTIEKEKHIIEQKYKNLQFKNQQIVKDNDLVKST
jgi:chromosome segregation ATPase